MEYMIQLKRKYQIFNMKKKGSISIFLAIIFLSLVLMICVVVESARINAIQAKSQSVTYMASDSVVAGYARQVYEDYGILLVWNKNKVEDTLKEYIQANIKMADLEVSGNDFLQADLQDVLLEKQILTTDDGGDLFVEQISDYLKYAGMSEAIKKITNNSTKIKEETSMKNVDDDISDKTINKLTKLVDSIDKKIKDIATVDKLEKEIEILKDIGKIEIKKKNDIKRIQTACENIQNITTEKVIALSSAEDMIINYQQIKNEILKEKGYDRVDNDYLDKDLDILKKIKSKINSVNKFDVSSISKENINQISQISKDCEDIIEYAQSLKVSTANDNDQENKSIFDNAKDLLDKGVLSLVISNPSNISNASVVTSALPSNSSQSHSKENSELEDKAIMSVYGTMMFGYYLKPKKNNCLHYGLEYLVAGKDSDKSNLATVVERLVAIRHVPNLTCLLQDSKKMSEIEAVSSSVAVITGLPFMEPVAKMTLIEAWVMAESINDIKILLNDEKLSLIKTSNNWKTTLSKLASDNTKGEKEGFKYKTYVELLLMLCERNSLVYRTMDLIQMNICKNYNSEFDMKNTTMKFRARVIFKTPPLFTSMPWTVNMLSKTGEAYKYNVVVTNGY